MGVLALTNNMITFTFFQSKITLSFALFQKCFSESAAKTLDSLGKVLYNGCDSFEKVQRNRIIRLKKCLYAINGTLLFGGDHYILSGIIPLFISILYPKWYKSINLAELHNVEHLIQYSVNSGMPTLVKMTIIPMAHRVVVGFEMVKKHIHYFSFKLYILKK